MAFKLCCFLAACMIINVYSNPIQINNSDILPENIGLQENYFRLSNNSVEHGRIEQIKRDILQKLGLDRAPTERFSRANIPDALLQDLLSDEEERNKEEEEDEEAETRKKVIVLGKLEKISACGRNQCVRLRFEDKPSTFNVESIQLWVFKKSKQRRIKSSVMSIYKENENKTKRKLWHISRFRSNTTGWFATDVTKKSVLKETSLGKTYVDLTIEIQCKNCLLSSKLNELPFLSLSIVTKTTKHKRQRRQTDGQCDQETSCCLAPLKVDFKAIGWENWVMAPESYSANYCAGNCLLDDSFHYQHTGILKAIIRQTRRKDIKLCCTPKKFKPLTMLYMNEGNIIRKEVPNMIVDKCWCK